MQPWPQPVDPLHHLPVSAIIAVLPLALLLILMGGLRKSGWVSAGWALIVSLVIAATVWGMPLKLAVMSVIYGAAYAIWAIMWIVFTALWLYNLSVDTGKF